MHFSVLACHYPALDGFDQLNFPFYSVLSNFPNNIGIGFYMNGSNAHVPASTGE